MKTITAAILICGVAAFASPVTYSTSATFSGPDLVGTQLINGGATITFTGLPSTGVDAPTNLSLGYFTVAGGTGTFMGDSVFLKITQTAPTSGSGVSSSTIDGKVTSTSNGITVTFSPTIVTIGVESYDLLPEYLLVAPNTNGGVSTVEATVTAVSAPEPASLWLIGLGLLTLFATMKRSIAS